MRVVIYTNTISPHQLPLAKEIVAITGSNNFRYVYTEKLDDVHGGLFGNLKAPMWCMHVSDSASSEWLEYADVVLSGLRCFELFGRRADKGLKSFYMTERWFRPPEGILRLLHPKYFEYAKRLFMMMQSGAVVGLPIGIHAACDMVRLCGVMHGDLKCLFKAPRLEFERKPGGRVYLAQQNTKTADRYCLDNMRMWGYFVEEGIGDREGSEENMTDAYRMSNVPTSIHVLWVGRLVALKRVDTIIRAVGEITKQKCGQGLTLNIYGFGPAEEKLRAMATKYGDFINFHPSVSLGEVRRLMRSHDVYVLASNAVEGWGTVVSEALEEGMSVIGTYEAGSSATMLPSGNLFHAGDWRRLADILIHKIPRCTIGNWTAKKAAQALLGDM